MKLIILNVRYSLVKETFNKPTDFSRSEEDRVTMLATAEKKKYIKLLFFL